MIIRIRSIASPKVAGGRLTAPMNLRSVLSFGKLYTSLSVIQHHPLDVPCGTRCRVLVLPRSGTPR
jgi:hypothetical protein